MEQLIQDYLKSVNHYVLVNGKVDIYEVTPFIMYDEQHYRVQVTNVCCENGFELIEVNISDLLVFMHSVKK